MADEPGPPAADLSVPEDVAARRRDLARLAAFVRDMVRLELPTPAAVYPHPHGVDVVLAHAGRCADVDAALRAFRWWLQYAGDGASLAFAVRPDPAAEPPATRRLTVQATAAPQAWLRLLVQASFAVTDAVALAREQPCSVVELAALLADGAPAPPAPDEHAAPADPPLHDEEPPAGVTFPGTSFAPLSHANGDGDSRPSRPGVLRAPPPRGRTFLPPAHRRAPDAPSGAS